MIAGRRHLKQIAPFFLQRPRGFPERDDNDGGNIVRAKNCELKIKIYVLQKVKSMKFCKTLAEI